MTKTQKNIVLGLAVVIAALLVWQFIGLQKQITRHENALNFWQVEVPKVQAEFPDFEPGDIDSKIAEENKMFAHQQKAVYIQSGIILIVGILGIAGIFFYPRIKKK